MAAFNKFNSFAQDLAQGQVNLNSDVLKIMLTNTAPVNTNHFYSDISGNELANGNGYTTGGATVGSTACTQSAGVAKLVGNQVVFTATGSMGPFRYAVLYDNTAPSKNLIGWWDYGSSITLANTDTFTIQNSNLSGNWTTTYPILSLT